MASNNPIDRLDEAAKALERVAGLLGINLSPSGGPAPAAPLRAGAPAPNLPLEMARPGGNPFGNMGAEAHFYKLGLPGPGDVADKRRQMFPEESMAGGKQAMDAFAKALRSPVKALDQLAEAGGKLGATAEFAAGALRTFGALRGAYGSAQSLMERGNPNMAGQMQGTIDLMANRLAGALSPAIEQLNAGLQGMTDARPGASIGGLAGAVTLPMVVMAVLAALGGPVTITVAAAAAVVGLFGGASIGSWLGGEKALPSSRGLPQPSMGDSASSWYDQAMMKSLAMQPGTVEAENARRQTDLLAQQIGLLTSIDNSVRGSAPSFR